MKARQVADSIAYCALICSLCQPEENCSCKGNNHCGQRLSPEGCYQYDCCREKGLSGCWECGDADCCEYMLAPEKIKRRTFVRCIKEDGIEQFSQFLTTNQEKEIVYHRTGIMGDYDLETEEDILGLLRSAK